jgi:hypothetical protein
MSQIDMYRGQWGGQTAIATLDARATLGDRLMLGFALWTMLGMVAVVVLAARYFIPALLVGVAAGVAGLAALGVV